MLLWTAARVVIFRQHLPQVLGVSDVIFLAADSIGGCGDCCWESHGILPALLVLVVFCYSSFVTFGFVP